MLAWFITFKHGGLWTVASILLPLYVKVAWAGAGLFGLVTTSQPSPVGRPPTSPQILIYGSHRPRDSPTQPLHPALVEFWFYKWEPNLVNQAGAWTRSLPLFAARCQRLLSGRLPLQGGYIGDLGHRQHDGWRELKMAGALPKSKVERSSESEQERTKPRSRARP